MGFLDTLLGPTRVEKRSFSVGDPALAEWLGIGARSAAGESVTESTSLGLTAVWRAVSLIAGTIASLPLKTYRRAADDTRARIPSFLDDPAGPDSLTPFEWTETLLAHLLLHGNGFGLRRYNQGGALIGLQLLHPSAVTVTYDPRVLGYKAFTVQLYGGPDAPSETRTFGVEDIVHFTALSTDGVKGLSPLSVMRNAFGVGMAGERTAGRTFKNGLMFGGLVSGDDQLSPEQAEQIKAGIMRQAGADHSGELLVVNRSLTFSPWTMSAEDAQFLESRQFSIEEIARAFGVPRELLSASGATSWGSGISELVRAFQKFSLVPWTSRIEARLSRLLPAPRFVEFEYRGLLEGSPDEVTANLAAEIDAGLLTVNEGRRVLNREPLPAPAPPEVTP